jgi:cell fate regulator YaaT (PSP1 superfamily)
MADKIYVRLRESGPLQCFKCSLANLKDNDVVIVEADRGLDYGYVVSNDVKHVLGEKIDAPTQKVIRLATEQDLEQIRKNNESTKSAFDTCLKKIAEHKLGMQLLEAEYSFDKSKLIFYFTAEGRVDFRNLVKDLAKIFKTRIELRQVGPRDEAKIFGGYGSCGRELCCVKFLKEFEQITIKMAKEQFLPLNPPKISGPCGKLMCCLRYEHATYKELSKDLPREGERITTAEGKGKVISVNALTRKVVVEIEQGRLIELDYKQKHG